jgi:NAD(P)-dependent dehydrogenase (short-subunit alcohol dehydrogenase family)
VQSDIAKLDDIDKLYAAVAEGHGKFDILFANAGGGAFLPLGEITEEHFDQIFRTNVKGTVFSVQKALPFLNDGGSIILNGSTASIMGTESLSVYSATKAALRAFVRSWTLDLKGKKLRVNLVSPGATDTPGFRGIFKTEEELAQFQAAMANSIPLGRIAEPAEIAKAVVFLASDDSSYVNGVELFVDGGMAQV